MNLCASLLPSRSGPPRTPDLPAPHHPVWRMRLDTRILIIEDEAIIAWMIESIFEEMGFTEILLTSSGADALAAALRSQPGLVVSDVNLGAGLDGIDTAVRICGADDIPVLFVSAYADDRTRARIARDLPSAPLLRKPLRADALRETVAALLQKRRSR